MIETENVFTLLKSAERFLDSKGVPDAKASAETLLAFVLKTKRSKLALIREQKLSENEVSLFKEYLLRRAQREPAAYITGFCGFMGFEFKVNENVLIPRPETELLIEEVLAAKLQAAKQQNAILDLCAGSGCIAISLAKLGNFKSITAADISPEALNVAKENAKLLGASEIKFVESDLFQNLSGYKFDIIISNPPYVSENEYLKLEPELTFEPKIALTTQDNGLFFYKKISIEAPKHLNPGGMIFLELNANKAFETEKIFKDAGFKNIKIINDYSNLPRVLKANL